VTNLGSALQEFLGQPLGAIGAVCIMLAVTVVNSVKLKSIFPIGGVTVDALFNVLNLIGGSTLLANAILRDEAVWTVLETYFIAVALKGIIQSIRSARRFDWSSAVEIDLTGANRDLAGYRVIRQAPRSRVTASLAPSEREA
jgi:hypothetical protein